MATPWVLKRYQVDETGGSGAYVFIEARQPGLTGFLLNLVGLDPTATFKVTRGTMSFRSSGLFGASQVSTSMNQVGAFVGGYKKEWGWIVLAFFGLWFGISIDAAIFWLSPYWFPVFTIIIPAIFLVIYALRKNLYLGFETSGGAMYALTFSRGVLNNVTVDINQVEYTISLVNTLLGSVALGGSEYSESTSVRLHGNQATIVNAQKPNQPSLNAMAPAVAVPPGLAMPASNVAVPPGLEMPAAAPVAAPGHQQSMQIPSQPHIPSTQTQPPQQQFPPQ